MSNRETQVAGSLQLWRGVDQRSQPTLVPDGFFVMSRGALFGFGDNIERMPGKRLAGLLPQGIFNICQFDNQALVQGFNTVWMIPIEELVELMITFQPLAPDAPALSSVSYFTLTVTMPTLPLYGVTLSLQQSLDNFTWTTIATGLAALQIVPQTGLTDDVTYYYRAVAVNPDASTEGPSANATTLPRLPDAPVAPTFVSIVADGFTVVIPSLPSYAVTMNLQSSPDNATWTTDATGFTGGESYPVTGLSLGQTVWYRCVAVNTKGTTNGASRSVTTSTGSGDLRIAESGDVRITESGDIRITE